MFVLSKLNHVFKMNIKNPRKEDCVRECKTQLTDV